MSGGSDRSFKVHIIYKYMTDLDINIKMFMVMTILFTTCQSHLSFLFKVLLLLGASAAAAVVLNRALHWIFESSVADTKSITKETESVRSENLSIEKNKEQRDTNCLLEKKNSIVIENRTEIIEPNLLRLEMASVKENSTNKQTYHLASSEEKQEVKCNHSWSELIDEDISQV